MSRASTVDPFSGFPTEAFAFLDGLAKDNSKAYFDEHRADYDSYVVPTSRSFVVALGERLQARISPDIIAIPKANGSLGRINRDVRFSKDKSPYNTHLQFRFWQGANKNATSGVALRVSPEQIGIAVGVMAFDKPALARYRQAVVAEKSGKALVAALAKATKGKRQAGVNHTTSVCPKASTKTTHVRTCCALPAAAPFSQSTHLSSPTIRSSRVGAPTASRNSAPCMSG